MQTIKLNVTFQPDAGMADGEYPVTPLVQVQFEREFKVGLAKALTVEQRQEHLYWMAWACMRAAGQVVKPWGDGFLALLDDVKVVPREDPTDATL